MIVPNNIHEMKVAQATGKSVTYGKLKTKTEPKTIRESIHVQFRKRKKKSFRHACALGNSRSQIGDAAQSRQQVH